MARRLAITLLGLILAVSGTALMHRVALAAELDTAGEAEAKEATRLYKQGMYEEAAKLYAKLSVDHPDMPIFERNMGACYYYLRRPGPALSNLRNYLLHKKDIAADDKAVVDRWIEEMEQLRAENEAAVKAPPAAEPAAPASAPVAPSFPAQPAATPMPPVPAFPEPVPVAPAPLPAAPPPAPPRAAVELAAAPTAGKSAAAAPASNTRWWLWGTVGVVVAAGVAAAVVLSRESGGSNIPATVFGNQEAFR